MLSRIIKDERLHFSSSSKRSETQELEGTARFAVDEFEVSARARTGGLGDAETEHQKFTMDPRRTPEKVLTRHLCDQMADFTGNPRAPAAQATPGSISPKR